MCIAGWNSLKLRQGKLLLEERKAGRTWHWDWRVLREKVGYFNELQCSASVWVFAAAYFCLTWETCLQLFCSIWLFKLGILVLSSITICCCRPLILCDFSAFMQEFMITWLIPSDSASTHPQKQLVVYGVLCWTVPTLHHITSRWQNPQPPYAAQSVSLSCPGFWS